MLTARALVVLVVLVAFAVLAGVRVHAQDLFELNVVHYNDFHARFEETSPFSGICNPASAPCIGGFPRLYTAVQERLAAEPDSLLFNAGDTFQGTVWYNFLRWNVTEKFMNLLPHDAHALGNHEFDHGVEGVVPYLERLNQPMLAANIDDSLEPAIQGLYNKSIVLERRGRKIGVIGVILTSTASMAPTGRLVFTDEVEAVRSEAERLTAEGIDIIIVLSHCGLDLDREIARRGGPHIDIIVGGHSHTLLYTGDTPSGETAADEYPTLEESEDGHIVLIVQASAYTKYLGEIKLFIDENGVIERWEGEPIYLSNEIVQDPEMLALLEPYRLELEAEVKRELAIAKVTLNRSWCYYGECSLGSFLCDGFMDSVMDRAEEGHWHYAHACLINRGGIRTQVDRGPVTLEGILLAIPFENVVETFELRGDYLREALEFSVSASYQVDSFVGSRMVQLAGLQVEYNVTLPIGSRVVDVRVRCIECRVPVYEPLQLDKYYRMVMQDYVAQGGGGFTMISNNRRNVEIVGVDFELIQNFVEKLGHITQGVDGRIILHTS